jgi:hypothetical protein
VAHDPGFAPTVLTAAGNAFKITATFLAPRLLKFADKVAKVGR